MFKYLIPLALVTWAVVLARPQIEGNLAEPEVYVVNSTYIPEGGGKFYSLEIKSDGSRHEQRGFFKNGAQVIVGSFSHPDEFGNFVTTNYVADRYGFHPSGDHLPSPPPPEVI